MSDFDTADILESQADLLKRWQSQTIQTLLAQHTLSKRQLLKFVENTDEFVKDFIALNERTINIIRRQDNEKSETGAQLSGAGTDQVGDIEG